MIPKSQLLALCNGVNPRVIEKDYVLGWVLAGINQHEISDSWFFKGGTCLKKCYFETYRFSEDLDFTLKDSAHINGNLLLEAFTDISEWIYEQSGIDIPTNRLKFDVYSNPRNVKACQARLYYRGPVTPNTQNNMPKLKLDLSADEILVDTPVSRVVNHNYSDYPESGIHIQCYSYEEVFAEKIRALRERTRPRDLYDVINFYRRAESNKRAGKVKQILAAKCEYKSLGLPTYDQLIQHKEVCKIGWEQQLRHQMVALPSFDSYWVELPDFFDWLYAINDF